MVDLLIKNDIFYKIFFEWRCSILDKSKIYSKIIIGSILAGTAIGLPSNVMAEANLPKDMNDIKMVGAKDAVKYLYETNKMGGYADGTFKPTKDVTRAEFMAMVLRLADFPETKTSVEFSDVKTTDWHYETLKKAYKAGLMSGQGLVKGKVKMSPNSVITRQEMLAILVRVHELKFGKQEMTQEEIVSTLLKFEDKDEIPEWAKNAVAKSLKYKITSGISENKIGGSRKGNRSESAVFSYRFLKEIEKATVKPPVVEVPPVENPPVEEVPVEIVDAVKPIIVLIGDETVELTKGDVFIDEGVTATDDKDGEITNKVVTTSTFVANTVGTFLVKYNVTDIAGNVATEVVRTIIVSEPEVVVPVPELDANVVYVKNNKVKIEEATAELAERFQKETANILFVSKQPMNDGATPTPVDYQVKDIANLIVALNHGTKVDGKFPNTTLYTVKLDSLATEVSIDLDKKEITAKETDSLSSIKAAFETKATSVVGPNEVDMFVKHKSTDEVNANMLVLIKDINQNVEKKMDKYSFGDNLIVSKEGNGLKVQGLQFEDMVDLYKWNGTAFVEEKFNTEIKPDGTFTFDGLSFGKYKVVHQPKVLGNVGDVAYDAEYSKRVINESVHEIEAEMLFEENESGKYRIKANYGTFAFDTTDNAVNFFKEKQKIAQITGSGDLNASVVYQDRAERLKLKSMTANFGTELVAGVTYQTVDFSAVGDFTQFKPGETIKFSVVLEDKVFGSADIFAQSEIKLQAKVYTNPTTGALSVVITPQESLVVETPEEPSQGEVGLSEDVVYLENYDTQVLNVKNQLQDRFSYDLSKIHLLKPQAVNDGGTPTPTDYKVNDIESLFVTVKHGAKVDNKYPMETVYKIVINENATDVAINVYDKKVEVKSIHTLVDIMTAFETKATAVIGPNEVSLYSVVKDGENVRADMVVMFENDNKQIVKTMDDYVFENSLIIFKDSDSLTAKGLQFEDKIDLYKWDGSKYIIETANIEVGVKGEIKIPNLPIGKYKIVKQPLNLGVSGDAAYDAEYEKRLINEKAYEISAQIILIPNLNEEYRMTMNYNTLAFDSTDDTIDFLKAKAQVAVINGGSKLFAEAVFENRIQLVNFKSMKLNFNTEDVDVDENPATPDVTFQTVALNSEADFSEFVLGEVVNFKLVLSDVEDATSELKAKIEIPYTAKVVIDGETDTLKLVIEEVK